MWSCDSGEECEDGACVCNKCFNPHDGTCKDCGENEECTADGCEPKCAEDEVKIVIPVDPYYLCCANG